MTRCNRPDCGGGAIDEQGFCETCDRRPAERPRAEPPAPVPRPGRGAGVGVAQVRPDPWYGLGLVESDQGPPVPEVPPRSAEPVAEEHRFCPNPACRQPVGRGRGGGPGRAAGFCAECGTGFDFTQLDGLTIAGRYDVERVLGSGAYGAAYLAHDRNLATHVVLKALHSSVARTALHERDALVELRHDSIVRILGYEPEGPHLVLEYVPGVPLSAGDGDRLETLLAHGVRVLQALDYLHARGLLHCDVKPLNIMRFRELSPAGPQDRVRLIDFGAVRRHKDEGPLVAYTPRFAPPEGDPEHRRPTPGFDLFSLGRTLHEVCRSRLDGSAPGTESLALLLERATDTERPARRFVSARQFAEQLSGVIRQVVAAAPAHRQVARPSALFGSMPDALHGGLGTARPLAHWVEARPGEDGTLTMPAPFSSPGPGDIAAALPAPLSDPDAPDMAGSTRRALAESRLAVRRRDPQLAERALAAAGLPDWHWLHAWYRGLIALADEDPASAATAFTAVREAVPGELIPQLALGLCAELRGLRDTARAHYGAVFDTTPAVGAAGFGLARVRLLAGDRTGAVAAAVRLAQEFRHEREARVAAVRLSVTVLDGPALAVPGGDDLERAGAGLDGLGLDGAAAAGLRAEIRYAHFLHHRDRERLSEAIRGLGPHAPTEREYVALVDLANRLRPPLRWGWRAGRDGTGRSRAGGASRPLSS
ncbi:serine/threonine protein kinase [Streptomyces zinciresistens K42]|uniref:non-specific serine/threonine protein kinase n=1 Tax=Streptomyces zinciresistens K42 TaxID=700597 RepID=G2GK06_9ACTN|nr:tetratricopeptide repeat protein [Streptomyces zinciresistens]EGX56151.1 serine/threonine protein kinase [Streptomyces zinciresistens K42]